MGTNTYTKADIQILTSAIMSGSKKVKLNDREVEYQSILQMKQALNEAVAQVNMEDELAGVRSRRPRVYRAHNSKGL